MGYDIIGYQNHIDSIDDKYIFAINCMYAYEPIFIECFGKNIMKFNGNLTQTKIEEFEKGVERFISHPEYNQDHRQSPGYLSNITYDELCIQLKELLRFIKDKKIKYLSIS